MMKLFKFQLVVTRNYEKNFLTLISQQQLLALVLDWEFISICFIFIFVVVDFSSTLMLLVG